MTSERRFEQDLPDLLAELALGSMPDYRDDIVQRTARMRQRSAWAFPERWLPVDLTTRRVFLAPVRWRTIGVMLLVAALVAAAVIAFGGGRPRQLPAPFGPAGNGLIAYAAGGDIYLGDPASEISRAVTSGPERDHDPRFSKLGSQFVFLRDTADGSAVSLLIANADGTGIRTLTRTPLTNVTGGDWSADGHTIVIVSSIAGRQVMSVMDVGRGEIHPLDMGMQVQEATFIPPRDVEIAFDSGAGKIGSTTYAVKPDGRGLRVLVSGGGTTFSPDGSWIVYNVGDKTSDGADRIQVHVIGADGRGERTLENPAGVQYQGSAQWSPDGSRLLVERAYANGSLRLVVVPAAGGREVEFDYIVRSFGEIGWSPDGSKVLFTSADPADGTVLFDVANGATKTFPHWLSPNWQRVAP
jgi:Tol biopolymer transport system component